MKKTLLFLSIPLLLAGLMLFTSFGGDENSDYPSGSPAGYTGSPFDGQDCHNCHGGTTAFIDDWITSDIPPEGYTPGYSYTITVTVTGSGDKGFEVSPQNINGDLLGVLTAGPGNKLVGSGKYVTQTAKSSSDPKIWNFGWTAPPPGTGEVTFYGAFTLNKPVTKTSTLIVQENPAIPFTIDATADPTNVHIGDSSHLGVAVSGGSGSYTYSWTSDPAGFTSSLPDPWVIPEEDAFYFVEVSDGAALQTDSVEVTIFGVGTEEMASGLSLSVFPNPTTSHLTIRVSGTETINAEMVIYSLSGEPLISRQIRILTSASAQQVDLSALPAGSYILQIRNGKNQITRKIGRIN